MRRGGSAACRPVSVTATMPSEPGASATGVDATSAASNGNSFPSSTLVADGRSHEQSFTLVFGPQQAPSTGLEGFSSPVAAPQQWQQPPASAAGFADWT